MRETYKISKGNQYDGQGGYSITNGINWGWGVIDDGRVCMSGNIQQPRDITDAQWQAVKDAIRTTMTDGQDREITVGQVPAAQVRSPEWRSARGLTLSDEMDREDTIY